MTEADVVSLLAQRYRAPEYAFIPQVRNATGLSSTVRTADAIAMGVWPSRGLELHGFEVKVERFASRYGDGCTRYQFRALAGTDNSIPEAPSSPLDGMRFVGDDKGGHLLDSEGRKWRPEPKGEG